MTQTVTRPPAVPPTLRRPQLVVAVLAALVVAVLAVTFAGDSTPSDVDRDTRSALLDVLPDSRDGAHAVDFLGEPVGLALCVIAVGTVCVVLRRHRLAVLAVLGTGVTITATTLLKHVADRTIHGEHLSYPSGHAASMTALALVLGLVVVGRVRAGPVVAVAVLGLGAVGAAVMAWAQIVPDAHYPTDAAAGSCTALAVILPCR